jgi:hypothetical protein
LWKARYFFGQTINKEGKTMKRLLIIVLFSYLCMATACNHNNQPKPDIQLSDVPTINKPFTPTDTVPTGYYQVDAWKYQLDQLVGHILITTKNQDNSIDSKFTVNSVLNPTSKIKFTTLTTQPSYSGIITNKFNAEVSGAVSIISLAASLESTQIGEVTIMDTANWTISDTDINQQILTNYITNNKPSKDQKRYLIMGAVLCSSYMRKYNSLTGSGTANAAIIKVSGKTYSSSEDIKRDYILKLALYDITDTSTTIPGLTSSLLTKKMVLDTKKIITTPLRLKTLEQDK